MSFRHGTLHLSWLLLHLLFGDSIGRVFRVGRPQRTISTPISIHCRTDAIVNSKRLGHVVEHSFLHLEKSRGKDGTGNSRLDCEFVREVKGSVETLVVVPSGIAGVQALVALARRKVTLVVPSVVGTTVGANGPVRVVIGFFVDLSVGRISGDGGGTPSVTMFLMLVLVGHGDIASYAESKWRYVEGRIVVALGTATRLE